MIHDNLWLSTVRQKVKEILNLVQNDDLLREERKKSKKNKDKYVGIVGGGGGGYGSRYCESNIYFVCFFLSIFMVFV